MTPLEIKCFLRLAQEWRLRGDELRLSASKKKNPTPEYLAMCNNQATVFIWTAADVEKEIAKFEGDQKAVLSGSIPGPDGDSRPLEEV